MPHYVVLNFEDPNPGAGPGTVVGTKKANPAIAGAAAAGTLQVYHNRAERKSSFFNNKSVVYYSCMELVTRDANKTLSRDDAAQIRADIADAKTIAIVIHGKPDDTDQGFTTAGAALCTWQDLGRLALLLFPDKSGKVFNVALIMCYGARSQNAALDHNGQIPANDLKTSFAYKFFRSICQTRNIRMTARTGAVSNDAAINHTVETEEQVFVVMEKKAAMGDRALNKAAMDIQKTQTLTNNGVTPQQFDTMLNEFAMNPLKIPANAVETFAKSYVIFSPYMAMFIANQHTAEPLGNRSKYGKLIYNYNGVLEIVSRYDHSGTGRGDNYVLYNGPLL